MAQTGLFVASVLLAGTVLASMAFAQRPAFEVATLKVSPPPEGDSFSINLGTIRSGRLTLTNASLSDCLKFAFGIASDWQLAGPAWMTDKLARFDVVAQVPAGTPREQALLMLQTLLADRLKLAWHFEKREISHLELVPGRNGVNLKLAKPDEAATTAPQHAGRIVHNQMSMELLARLLGRFERQPVTDQTGLAGLFDIRLEWLPDGAQVEGAEGPSIYTALQQLGLRLLPKKSPLDVLVVDQAVRVPVDN